MSLHGIFRWRQNWHWHTLWPWQRVVAVNGSVLTGVVKRRRVDGRWEYRSGTDEENSAEEDRQAFQL